jgi:hypothetical protein
MTPVPELDCSSRATRKPDRAGRLGQDRRATGLHRKKSDPHSNDRGKILVDPNHARTHHALRLER